MWSKTHLQTRTCPLPLGARGFYSHICLPNMVRSNTLYDGAICCMGTLKWLSMYCMYLIYSGAIVLVPTRVNVFYMAVNCEWAWIVLCGGCGAYSETRGVWELSFLHSGSPFLSKPGSTHSPLDLPSHLPSNTEVEETIWLSWRRQVGRMSIYINEITQWGMIE